MISLSPVFGEVTTFETQEIRQVISKETADTVASMMESVVTSGTGKYGAVSGYSIGGTSVGEPKDVMYKMIEDGIRYLPTDKPRYLMGVGDPLDILEGIERGIDMFDCVLPTRLARHGHAFTKYGKINGTK